MGRSRHTKYQIKVRKQASKGTLSLNKREGATMKMLATLVLMTASSAHGGKIVFKERPRDHRRFGGVDIFPSSTAVWDPVQFTSSSAPETADNNLSSNITSLSNATRVGAVCPDAAAWCSQPVNYPEEAILRAVKEQGDAIQILFPKEHKPTKEVLTLDPSIPVDDSVLGNRFGGSGDDEGAEEVNGSGDEELVIDTFTFPSCC